MSAAQLVSALPAATAMEGVLSHRPELLEHYREFYLDIWRGQLVPHRILELCRLSIAHVHGCDAEWLLRDQVVAIDDAECKAVIGEDWSNFSEPEQIALQLAQLMPFNHHQITDEQIATAGERLGNPGCVALLIALGFFDVTCRLKLVWGIDPASGELTDSHLA